MPDVLKIAAWLLQVLLGYNLVLPFFLYLAYLFRSKRKAAVVEVGLEPDYAVIVTAYEQTHTLPPVIQSLLQLDYTNYHIYIVADKCDVSNLSFGDGRVTVLRPPETLASNTRSHFYAINHFHRQHERLTIIDSDNLVESDYLRRLNPFFAQGFNAVQGVRKAKNTDTVYASLDAARDLYYHFYDGEVLFRLGSSATLAGSGMAFTVDLYKSCLGHLDLSGAGFDKVLQYQILSRNDRIAFAEEAVVYDEKTARTDQLVNQRARWINTWFRYFAYGFTLLKKGVVNGSWNQFLFGLILLRPPLFIFLLLSMLCLLVNLWVSPITALVWGIAFLLFVAGFFVALAHAKAETKIYKAMLRAPLFIFYQVLSLRKVRNANKHSVATKHSFGSGEK